MKKSFQEISENISETISQAINDSIEEDSDIFKIKTKNTREDLFTDLSSPYATAPQHVKALFAKE